MPERQHAIKNCPRTQPSGVLCELAWKRRVEANENARGQPPRISWCASALGGRNRRIESWLAFHGNQHAAPGSREQSLPRLEVDRRATTRTGSVSITRGNWHRSCFVGKRAGARPVLVEPVVGACPRRADAKDLPCQDQAGSMPAHSPCVRRSAKRLAAGGREELEYRNRTDTPNRPHLATSISVSLTAWSDNSLCILKAGFTRSAEWLGRIAESLAAGAPRESPPPEALVHA
jgi:hypothetical protein